MTSDELKIRTKSFALRIIKLVESLPITPVCKVIGNQVLISTESVCANYSSACRTRSIQEFISKKRIAEEAAEKSIYLQDLIRESKIISEEIISALLNKANELTVIFTSIGKTSKQNLNYSKSENQNLK